MTKSLSILYFYCFFYVLNINSQTKFSQYVNPFIGTGGNGHTFPGAVVPFGMVQLSPDTRVDGSWEGCGGYHYSDSIIYGFSHTHLSGTGVSDYGDVLIMPVLNANLNQKNNFATKFSHQNEIASAGFYKVKFVNDIDVQLTATQRVGIHQYSFPNTDTGSIFIDLLHRDKTLKCTLKVIDSVTVIGSRISEGWALEQHIYFRMKFSKPIIFKKLNSLVFENKIASEEENIKSGIFQFDVSDGKPLIIKVGISQTSTEGAKLNLEAEAKHWNFEKYKQDAAKSWEKELSKIEVETFDTEKITTFYSALYHCMIHPSLAGDVDGKYRGRDFKIHKANNFTPYTIFSLWDTFRGLHPLFTIIEKKRTADFINTFLQQHIESGRLPMWELSANETDCMIAFHSVSVISDAISKNLTGFDKKACYNAMLAASNYSNFSIPLFNEKKFLQIDDESESVSKTLEYAYDNWCIAQVSKKLNYKLDFEIYNKRALAYKNVFDNKSGFMRPRKNGNWLSPFEPREVNNHYTEANSWQYTFFVPQDITGLISLMGGEKKFESKLDELFNESNVTLGRQQADITGLIGQYAHGNEPSHHMCYLYNFIGKPFKTQEKIYQVLNTFYKNTPDGLIGNEDCGQMSAWFVLSAMGFYQVCPGLPEYTIGFPLFNTVRINLENGKKFEINKDKHTSEFEYISSSTVNGKISNSAVISHSTLINGGKIEFAMQEKLEDKSEFGKAILLRPKTEINSNQIIQVPVIVTPSNSTEGSKTVTIEHPDNTAKLYYTLDGTNPTINSNPYSNSFNCDSTLIIKAIAVAKNNVSSIATATIFKRSNNWKISIQSQYNKQYDAGGDEGIIDGQYASRNWRSGGWQGYQGQDFNCIVDLGKVTLIQSVTSSFLQDTRSWIIYPKDVEFYISEDGIDYQSFGIVENGVDADDYSIQTRRFFNTSPIKVAARYIKIKATNYGKLPEWHLGRDGDAYLFIDEIDVR